MRDYATLTDVSTRARLAVAPLTRVAGIQNKVLDAASVGLAQVVSPQALEGFRPGFPLEPCADDAAFVASIVELLQDDALRTSRAEVAADYVEAMYSARAWLPWAEALLA